jgi:hypothetical protein
LPPLSEREISHDLEPSLQTGLIQTTVDLVASETLVSSANGLGSCAQYDTFALEYSAKRLERPHAEASEGMTMKIKDGTMTPTNTKWKSSEKFPGKWELWHSYDGGLTWTLVKHMD